MLRHFVNCFLYFFPPTRFFRLRRFLLNLAGVDISENANFCGRGWVYGRGKLSIGQSTWLSPGAQIFTHIAAPISIGNSCDIGPGVSFITGSHEIGPAHRRAGAGIAEPISIGDGTWIGANVTILGGVKIGPGCVIAAGALVSKSVSENSFVAGVPAVVKKVLK